MIKISYLYGTMNSSKTANLLMTCHNYEAKRVNPLLVKPSLDTRSKYIESRIGLKKVADYVIKKGNAISDSEKIFKNAIKDDRPILLDECQFFEPEFINNLCELAHSYWLNKAKNVSIMAYGLLTDFMGKLFDGSKAWLENADNIREIKTTCAYCNHKAVYNALFKDGKLVIDGDSDIVIGDDEYKSLCPYHYLKAKNESLRG